MADPTSKTEFVFQQVDSDEEVRRMILMQLTLKYLVNQYQVNQVCILGWIRYVTSILN
jgi:hypothetical protein